MSPEQREETSMQMNDLTHTNLGSTPSFPIRLLTVVLYCLFEELTDRGGFDFIPNLTESSVLMKRKQKMEWGEKRRWPCIPSGVWMPNKWKERLLQRRKSKTK